MTFEKETKKLDQTKIRKKMFSDWTEGLDDNKLKHFNDAGFDLSEDGRENLVRHSLTGIDGSISLAKKAGFQIDELSKKESLSKVVFPQKDKKVLKLQEISPFLSNIEHKKDEVSFYNKVREGLGDELAKKVIVKTEFAGNNVPGVLQEQVITSVEAIKMAHAKGDSELVDLIKKAHASNPLGRNYIYEQKIKNSGLIARDDQVFVVAFDIADGLDLDHVEGEWKKVKKDFKDIVSIPLYRFNNIDEFKDRF